MIFSFMKRSVSFIRMNKEQGERRVFLPQFVGSAAACGADVFLEEGYGSELGFSESDFAAAAGRIRIVSRKAAFSKDIVLVLRCPDRPEFALLGKGSCLFSMIHFPTRPWRVRRLAELGAAGIALDCITDDQGKRLVENLRAVAWNGVDAGFHALGHTLPDYRAPGGRPLSVLVLGTGAVGRYAVDAAAKYGDPARNERQMKSGAPGVTVTAVGRNVTGNEAFMRSRFESTDILVDATKRRDSSVPLVENRWLSSLPRHAVIVDLSVDPYLLSDTPPVVRGIEGIPQGDLDRYEFPPEDPIWDTQLPRSVPHSERRTVVSCYSWPGVHPEECMEHYGKQILPFLEVLVRRGYEDLRPEGGFAERALYRAMLRRFAEA